VSAGSARGGTILLVEDEEDIASLVRTYLENDGFRVIWAARSAEGALALEQHDIRLAILDLQLPDGDGLDLCRSIRRTSRLPIVIVTARDEEVDRITGLELGADDYMTKPFSPRELVARVHAVLRRAEPDETGEQIALGDVVLDPAGRTVSVADRPVELTAMEFDLLAFLLAHPGIVMSRERLLERVWGLAFPGGTRTVDVHVAQLRKKLDRPGLIRTVRGSGYKAVPEAAGAARRSP
jgi:DNA-binding response OmpR family regulator